MVFAEFGTGPGALVHGRFTLFVIWIWQLFAIFGDIFRSEDLSGWRRRCGRSMAMFVLVVDTSLMNVSIAAVVDDLDTTVSGVQSAIALEALVSAAFILIGGKVGDLIGRKRAYVLGLLGYAIGALAMTLAQSLTAIIVFWADHRRARRVAAAAGDAVAHPRQLRGRGPAEGVRARGRGGGDRGRPSARCSAASSPPTSRGGSGSCSRR